ncbi:hypothetical protein JCM10213_005275 [Rhodosporidiobolus nylandii]
MSSDAPRGRGRGRGRRTGATTLTGATVSASPSPAPDASRASTSEAATPAPEAVDDAPSGSEREREPSGGSSAPGSRLGTPAASGPPKPAVKRVASVGIASSRAGSVGLSRTPSVGQGAREGRVGGLLGSTSEFRAGAGGATGRAKFRPNMRKGALREAASDDDDDVKMEDGEGGFRRNRGPRPPRAPRQELEMTASGPMAQGPGGPPRAWGPRAAAGASGAAVMAASRAGTLNQMLDDDSDASDLEVDDDPYDAEGGVRFKAIDLNDIGTAPGEEEGMAPLVLPRDPKVLRTKIKRLKERKVERAKREAREKAKAEGLVKTEVAIDDEDVEMSTPGGTPGPSSITLGASLGDSKSSTPLLDSKEGSFDEDKEAKDLKDLEEEEKKEIILSEAFEVDPEARGELYMFQFPRVFPSLVPASSAADSLADLKLESDVKADPDAPPARRKPQPPQWGRFGTRQEKAARWSEEAGRIGELCVHKSGKVTLRINGDLRYEVLPAAQPSFLQEIAVLDHPEPKKPAKSKRSSSSSESSSSGSDSDSDSGRSSDSDRDRKKKGKSKKDKKEGKDAKLPPPDSLVLIGQTSKKFLVVPEVTDLLDKVAAQEKAEKDEERRIKMAKAGLLAGPPGAALKKEGKK